MMLMTRLEVLPENTIDLALKQNKKVDLEHSLELWETAEKTCMAELWDALSPWFEGISYYLYSRSHESPFLLTPPEDRNHAPRNLPVRHPYAYYYGEESVERQFFASYGVTAAVSSSHGDVVIKLLRYDCPELAIFNLLASEPMRSDPLNLTIPVVEILKYEQGYSFVVMPRWGEVTPVTRTGFDTLETAFRLVEDMLKSLTFLHKNHIAHRDLKPQNILVNYQYPINHRDLRSFFSTRKNQLRFVLCDFGLSVVFRPDTPASERVCPVEESDWGSSQYHPPDIAAGQDVYDPFPYDVACLGGVLCELVGNMTSLVPPLAPFLDHLITPDIRSRYSADQALHAFVTLKHEVDPHFLSSTPAPSPLEWGKAWQDHDRWAGLPPDFVRMHTVLHKPVRPRKKIQYVRDGEIVASEFVDCNISRDMV